MANKPNYSLIAGTGQSVSPTLGNPGSVSITKVEVIDGTPDSTGQPQKQITVTYAPPNPLGAFQGVWVYCDHPDTSIGSLTIADGTQAADGTHPASGAFSPELIGFFPYDPTNFEIRFLLPSPRQPEYWRVYVVSGSKNTQLKPVAHGQTGESPSFQFPVYPPAGPGAGREYAPLVENLALAASLPSGWSSNPNYRIADTGDQYFEFSVTWTWPTEDQNIQTLGGVNIVLNDGVGDHYIGNIDYSPNNPVTQYTSGQWPVRPGTRTYTLELVSYDINARNNQIVSGVTPSVSFSITRSTGALGAEYTGLVTADGVHSLIAQSPFRSASDGTALMRITAWWAAPQVNNPDAGTITDPTFGGVELIWQQTDGNYYSLGQARVPPIIVDVPNPNGAQAAAFYLRSIDINGRRNSIAPVISFSGGGGSGAFGFVTVVGGVITNFYLLNAGSGYTSAPTVLINGGLGANLQVSVSGGQLTSPTVVSGGSGYIGTPVSPDTVGTSAGQLNLGQTDNTHFSSEFQVVGGVFKIGTLDAAVVKTGQLQVGGGGGKVSEVKIFDTLGSLIGWIGDDTANSGFVGAWFKQLRVGGASPSSAIITADSSGNVAINGATFVLNLNGVTTTLNNSITGGVSTGLSVINNSNNAGVKLLAGASAAAVQVFNSLGNAVGRITVDVGGTDAGQVTVSKPGGKSCGMDAGVATGNPTFTAGPSGILILNDSVAAVGFQVDTSVAYTSTSATAGAQTLPGNPVGFLIVTISGTARKIPYYAT